MGFRCKVDHQSSTATITSTVGLVRLVVGVLILGGAGLLLEHVWPLQKTLQNVDDLSFLTLCLVASLLFAALLCWFGFFSIKVAQDRCCKVWGVCGVPFFWRGYPYIHPRQVSIRFEERVRYAGKQGIRKETVHAVRLVAEPEILLVDVDNRLIANRIGEAVAKALQQPLEDQTLNEAQMPGSTALPVEDAKLREAHLLDENVADRLKRHRHSGIDPLPLADEPAKVGIRIDEHGGRWTAVLPTSGLSGAFASSVVLLVVMGFIVYLVFAVGDFRVNLLWNSPVGLVLAAIFVLIAIPLAVIPSFVPQKIVIAHGDLRVYVPPVTWRTFPLATLEECSPIHKGLSLKSDEQQLEFGAALSDIQRNALHRALLEAIERET